MDKTPLHHPADMHMKGPSFGSCDRQETKDGGRIGYESFLIVGLRYPDAGKVATVDIFRTFVGSPMALPPNTRPEEGSLLADGVNPESPGLCLCSGLPP